MKFKKYLLIITFLAANLFFAKITLPSIFGDNMVLQRNEKIAIWGVAIPNEKVEIMFKNQRKSTITDEKGNWKIFLDPENFGGPFEMNISGENTIIFKNILIGDVWLCSGQSNMEWTVAQSEGYENERNNQNFPEIRHVKIEHQMNTLPQNNFKKANWEVAAQETIGNFSGVAYYFAKKLYQENHVPIGLINSCWGGTNIETWISNDAFSKSSDFKEMISKMPKVSLDSLQNQFLKEKTAQFEKIISKKIKNFSAKEFLENSFNDEGLSEILQPKAWEEQGFETLDGIVWIRKNITLTQEDITRDAQLFLLKIDDQDITYFNGVEVGATKNWDEERIYKISKNLLKVGENTIVIKIIDTGGGGGIYGKEENLKLVTAKNNISLAGNWKILIEKIQQEIGVNDFPSLAYNAMISPLIPYTLKGVIWYQGESNADRAYQYNKSFPLLINNWREKWQKEFPFYFVQLATFKTPGNSNLGCNWAELREAQTYALKLKNTGMVVTTDVGNATDIHPKNKKTVGDRLANLALKNGVVSPIFENFKIKKNKIIISFKNAENGLKTKTENTEIKGFEIAGNDMLFTEAKAKILKNKIIISNENIKKPVAARFGWVGDASSCNLFSSDGLPVSPFRTDDYKTISKNNFYQLNIK